MPETGKYIYGIIPAPKSNGFGDGVYAVPYQEISAVVSDSEIVDCINLQKDAAARFLIRHQQTIEKVMENFTVIPMRLGTFARDEEEVTLILTKAYPMVQDIFDRVHNKTETDVTATWNDFNSVIGKIGEEKEIKELKSRLLADPGAITVGDQMKVGLLIKKALEKRNGKCAERIRSALMAFSRNMKAHELMDDRMVINTAFLVENPQREAFYKEVESLDAEFNNELDFRCVGPLPPYSFYTLEVKKMDFKEIDSARKRLDLSNNVISKDQIKKAYQARAFDSHPDRNPDVTGIEEKFDEITRAYKILVDYCEAFVREGQTDIYSFGEEKFRRNAILVRVKE